MKRHVITAAAALLVACGGGPNEYDASGVFEATEVTVSARASGELVWFDPAEGQTVAADEAVGLVDTTQLYLQKMQLLGTLRAVDARRYDVGRQVASLGEQLSAQRREQARFGNLVRDGAATQKQLDDIAAAVATLEKQLAAQTATLASANASLDGEAQALAAQLAQLDDRIAKSVVASPIDGTVLARYAERGELAAQGRALFKVADLERMFLRVYITAGQLASIRLGQRVRVFADPGGDGRRREYAGTVSWISDRAEFTPKTIQTRDERANLVYAVKVAVPNDGYIRSGMYGDMAVGPEAASDAPGTGAGE